MSNFLGVKRWDTNYTKLNCLILFTVVNRYCALAVAKINNKLSSLVKGFLQSLRRHLKNYAVTLLPLISCNWNPSGLGTGAHE